MTAPWDIGSKKKQRFAPSREVALDPIDALEEVTEVEVVAVHTGTASVRTHSRRYR
jgi:hypothetical protein